MQGNSTLVTLFLHLVSGVELAVCLAVCVLLALRWWRARSAATEAAFGLFATVGLIVAASFVLPSGGSGQQASAAVTDVLVCVLLAVPYLLVRFTQVLGGLSGKVHLLAGGFLLVECAVTFAAPPLPAPGQPRPAWVLVYVSVIVGGWAVQSVAAARGLWRVGRGQPSVVRHRMRSLSLGALLLAADLVVSGAAGGAPSKAVQVGNAIVGLLSILLFALAFLLPASLRLVWRQADLTALSVAERELMTAAGVAEIAATMVPVLAQVLGGGAVLFDRSGVVVHARGMRMSEVVHLGELLVGREAGERQQERVPGVLVATLSGGWLVVKAGELAPVFGNDEAVLLDRAATLVDLALQRASLFEQERSSRRAAEAANAELETLLYSVSHDLRSPLISVLGYLDVLRQENAAQLTGNGDHYLDRITVNALYMQSLISDLLELSRIGRTDGPAEQVCLKQVTEQVLEAARLRSPAASIRALGDLPDLRMSDVRVRQLLTNLVDNALRHGGRDDVAVQVGGQLEPSGDLLLYVADDGRGVPPEYRERVLQVFERLDAPKSSPGTGMGLAICKRIAETVGGTVQVGGPVEPFPRGTTVMVRLPGATVLVAGEPAPVAGVPAPRTDPVGSLTPALEDVR